VSAPFEITVLRKAGNLPLTKSIALAPDGSPISDSSACTMAAGLAWRFAFDRIGKLAELIGDFGSDQALALGALRADLPPQVNVVTQRKLNGSMAPDTIARTSEFFVYRRGAPALALLDHDRKGMPTAVAERIERLGGLWPALVSVLPELADIARVERNSTSAGLYRADTGEQLPGSGGVHVFLAVHDGTDIERFLRTLHSRCWLAGLGWYMVSTAGQLLDRSIVDRVVGTPERLVFEGAPVLQPPLAQDRVSRQPVASAGGLLDTTAACPDLSILERARLKELQAKDAPRIADQARTVRRAYVADRAKELSDRTGMTVEAAAKIVENQCRGILLPDIVLPFDDEDLAGTTVGDVLADPERFVNATLADPREGVEYGTGKAKIMRRADGVPWIHSFAHGRTDYQLHYDYATAEAMLQRAAPTAVAELFVRVVLASTFAPDEIERLRNVAHGRGKIGKRVLDAMLKAAREKAAAEQRRMAREERLAQRRDPRPALPQPFDNEEWLPQMAAINEVLGAVTEPLPLTRDKENVAAQARCCRLAGLHALTSKEANPDEPKPSE
jgi:hypothetical protein